MRLGLSSTLTTYVARHAWASITKSKNISLSVISEAMGHDSGEHYPHLSRLIGYFFGR